MKKKPARTQVRPASPAAKRAPARADVPSRAAAKPAAAAPATAAEPPYRLYVENMQEGAVTLNEEGVVLYCNRRFADMLRLPLAKVTGARLPDHLSAEAWEKIRGAFDEDRERVRYETVLRHRLGTLPVKFSASRPALEGPPMLCVVVTDLTGQKQQEDLRLAKEVAERSSSAKDDFLATLSHELRTPLTPALMAATALEKDASLPASVRSDIAVIRRNIELEARLIDDLLDLTLITRGKLSLQTEETNVHAGLNRAIESAQAEARRKKQKLQIALEARRTQIVGDPVRIQQVCGNVLRNAVKFTPEGGTISILTGNDEHNQVWIRIADTGIGFSHEQASRLFEAFGQESRHRTRPFGGLGLGLAIARSVMHAHGGGIEGRSAGPGHGATFTLRFPLASAVPRKPAGKSAPARSLHILLVEDHRDTRLTLQRVLEASSHRLMVAPDAATALELAEANSFDLVISDLGLPDLSGHELMRRLHARHGLPGIALSGYGMEHDLEQSRAAGFRYHLTKPVSFDRLRSFLAEFSHQPEPTLST